MWCVKFQAESFMKMLLKLFKFNHRRTVLATLDDPTLPAIDCTKLIFKYTQSGVNLGGNVNFKFTDDFLLIYTRDLFEDR